MFSVCDSTSSYLCYREVFQVGLPRLNYHLTMALGGPLDLLLLIFQWVSWSCSNSHFKWYSQAQNILVLFFLHFSNICALPLSTSELSVCLEIFSWSERVNAVSTSITFIRWNDFITKWLRFYWAYKIDLLENGEVNITPSGSRSQTISLIWWF